MGTITAKEARFIQKNWKKAKDQDPTLTCKHPNGFYKEYHIGVATGDHICPDCGEDRNQ